MSTHLVAGPSHDAGQHREAAQNIQPPPTQASLTTSGSADLSRKISVTEGDHPLSQGRADEASRLKGRNASSSLTGRRLDGNDFIMPHDEATPPLAAVAANRLQSAERSSAGPVSIHAMSASGVAPNAQGNAQTANDGENEALSVRRNMLRNAWEGFTTLTRFRRWILILRLIIALAQVVAGITILALPSSLGDSQSYPEKCDPEGMFVFLVLHVARVACSIPIDAYLGLSPHRSPRARRQGAEGLVERERSRRIGSLHLDRKLGRLGDLLGFCHIVLFIVGNYVVWTSVECSHSPADSRPLFFGCVAMLCITYLIILEVALMVFLVVFFLPLLIAILSALGLSHRLPQRDIHPETGKISQDDIEKHSKLVYYTPAESNAEEKLVRSNSEVPEQQDANVRRGQRSFAPSTSTDAEIAVQTPLPLSRSPSVKEQTGGSFRAPDRTSTQTDEVPQSKRRRIGRLIGLSRRTASGASPHAATQKEKSNVIAGLSAPRRQHGETNLGSVRYPLYPIPAHRATCPICLCDYEEVQPSHATTTPPTSIQQQMTAVSRPASSASAGRQQATDLESGPPSTESNAVEPEPLRLLLCGHVMHKTCVDQWLTAVSGRCPVCQRAVLATAQAEEVDAARAMQGE